MCSPVDPCGACDYCDRLQARNDVARITRYIEERNPEMDRFFSLTFDPSDLEADGIADNYDAQLERALIGVEAAIEAVDDSANWVVGHEPQPGTGNCHLHGLVDSYLPVDQLRAEWVKQGGGQSVDIERVDDIAACADYMLAYCGDIAGASGAVPV